MARNVGLNLIEGEYLTFCDADDIMPKFSLEKRAIVMIEKDCDIVVGSYREIMENGNIKPSPLLGEIKESFWKIYSTSVVLWNKLYKTSFIKRNNICFKDCTQGEDKIFITELYVKKPIIISISDFIYDWMRRPSIATSVSYANDFKSFVERMNSWIAMYKIFDKYHIKEANRLLINWSPYLKSLFDNIVLYEDKIIGFKKIQEVMKFANWSVAVSNFRRLWGVDYKKFFELNYAEYLRIKKEKEPTPIYWYPDEGIKPLMCKYDAVMPIVTVVDDNYILPLNVLLISMKEHKSKDSFYEINIIANRISNINKQKIKLLEDSDFKVNFIDMVENFYEKYNIPEAEIKDLPATQTSLYKFLIPQIFTKYNKILYLDCDILILTDLKVLFNIDISKRFAAVGFDSLQFLKPSHNNRIHSINKTYFNTGVMLLNLEKMREDNVVNSLIEYRKNGTNYFMDQDAFNVVFNDNIIFLPFYYNMDYTTLKKFTYTELRKNYHLGKYKRLEILYRRGKILHFAGREKPWEYDLKYFSDLYKKYLDKTQFENESNMKKLKKAKKQIEAVDHFELNNKNYLTTTLKETNDKGDALKREVLMPENNFLYIFLKRLNEINVLYIKCKQTYNEQGFSFTAKKILKKLKKLMGV